MHRSPVQHSCNFNCLSELVGPFISNGTLLSEQKEAEKVRRKLARFWLSIEKRLYRRSFGGPYLLYVHMEAVIGLFVELHEGVCGNHIGGWSLVHRAMTQGF